MKYIYIYILWKKKNVLLQRDVNVVSSFHERKRLQRIMLKKQPCDVLSLPSIIQVLPKIIILEVHLFWKGQNNPPFEDAANVHIHTRQDTITFVEKDVTLQDIIHLYMYTHQYMLNYMCF
jgi:hypothetical protein